MKTTTLPYWGQIIGLVSQSDKPTTTKPNTNTKKTASSNRSLFITRQFVEPTLKKDELYILDNLLDNQGGRFELTTTPLPCAMHAIKVITSRSTQTEATDAIVMLGKNGYLYQTDWQATKITKISQTSVFDNPVFKSSDVLTAENTVTDIASIAIDCLQDAVVALYPNHIVIWSYKAKTATANNLALAVDNMVVMPYLPPNTTNTSGSSDASDDSLNEDLPSANATISTSTSATAFATSSDGHWLVVGDAHGVISSYQWLSEQMTEKDTDAGASGVLTVSNQKKIHDGRVTAVCFEPQGQYFFSAGADKHLFRTHVQGELQPIDRAKSSGHQEMITALCVSDNRLFSAADDKTIKSWPLDKGQPNTCGEELTKTRLLSLSRYNEQASLQAVGKDNSLRTVLLATSDTAAKEGLGADKLQDVVHIIKDGYQRVKDLLSDQSAHSDAAFEEGLALLADNPNSQTLEIANQLLSNQNNVLKASQALQLVAWIATTQLPKTSQVLEQQLNSNKGAKVRLAAFAALADKSISAKRPLHYLDVAIKNKHEEIVAAALQGYLQAALSGASDLSDLSDHDTATDATKILTSEQRRLLPILQQALSHSMVQIRRQALASLEVLLPDDSPKADLIALDSTSYDVIQAGLIRLYQRGMLDCASDSAHSALGHLEIARQLTLLQEHNNPSVRQTAFYVSLLANPDLADALKTNANAQGDGQLTRVLEDFNHFKLLRGTLLDNGQNINSMDSSGSHKELVNFSIHEPQTDNSGKNSNPSHQTRQKNKPQNRESSSAVNLELSTQDFVTKTGTSDTPNTKTKRNNDVKSKTAESQLDNQTLEPLLQALANSHADISFRAAYLLASLQDSRALGALIRLIHAEDTSIRAGVAAALGNLQQATATAILPTLLNDKDSGVRQVAMQAYGKLVDNAFDWASAGFNSSHQDIHEQALAIFLTQANPQKAAKKTSKKAAQHDDEAMTKVLQQALNNPFASIRQEVVKVLLNRVVNQSASVSSSLIEFITLLQQSQFEDVHQVALEEWQRVLLKANSKVADTINHESESLQSVLRLFFADSFAHIREQAFKIALKQQKQLGFSHLILAALQSPYTEFRKQALTTLGQKANHADLNIIMPDLVALFNDESLELRKLALQTALSLSKSLSVSFSESAKESANKDKEHIDTDTDINDLFIEAALNSDYPDIQLTVARLLASQPTGRSATQNEHEKRAYKVFEHYLTQPMPSQDKKDINYQQWHDTITQSLQGLSELGHPALFDASTWYAKYLNHPDADFDKLAINLMWVVADKEATTLSDQATIEELVQWQKSEKLLINQSASLALAVWGDRRGQQFFNPSTNTKTTNDTNEDNLTKLAQPLTPTEWLQAHHGLGITHAGQLKPFLSDSNSYEPYTIAARLLLAFADISNAAPTHMLEALPFVDNETAVFYANILARYNVSNTANVPHQSSNVRSDKIQLGNIWHYISGYLSRKLTALFSGFTTNIDNRALLNMTSVATTLEQDLSITPSEKPSQKLSAKQTSTRIAILSGVQETILQQLVQCCFSAHPLIKTQAIEVICHLSNLLHFSEYSDYETVIEALIQWQRSLQKLLTDAEMIGLDIDLETESVSVNPAENSYQDLAFGTLLGVIREGDAYYSSNTTTQAIRGLMFLAQSSISSQQEAQQNWQDSVSRVLLPLLNHNNFDTRELAWQSLRQLHVNPQKLAEQAMSSPHENMVKQGLHLLLEGADEEQTTQTDTTAVSTDHLVSLLHTNNATLTEAVYDVLKQRVGRLQASLAVLDIPLLSLRQRVVNEWAQVSSNQISNDKTENELTTDKMAYLQQAIKNDDWQTQYNAFSQLVDFKEVLLADNTLFDALFNFWANSDTAHRQSLVLTLITQSLRAAKSLSQSTIDNIKTDTKAIISTHTRRILDLLEHPQQIMSIQGIYEAIRTLRDITLFTPLLERLRTLFKQSTYQIKAERQLLTDTLLILTGYDQSIQNYYEDDVQEIDTHARWLKQQYPRYSQQLLALFNTLVDYGDYDYAVQLLHSLAWATPLPKTVYKTDVTDVDANDSKPLNRQQLHQAIDNALMLAYRQMPSKYASKLVSAMAYRADKRDGDSTGLELALQSRDSEVQYLAAEGLAKCGSFDGLSVLMATIDHHTDGDIRRRSVLALGELLGSGNANNVSNVNAKNNTNSNTSKQDKDKTHALYQAYDKLIGLAEDEEHYLQDVASEALGRLSTDGDFEYSEHIFELLSHHVNDHNVADYNPAVTHWLNGLRWLNTPQAWAVIRDYVTRYLVNSTVFYPQEHAISLLQYSDSDANKDLLLDILHKPASANDCFDEDALAVAYQTAQKLWGNEPDVVYPYDWAILRSHDDDIGDDTDYLSLNRIVKHSSIDELTHFINQYGASLPEHNLTPLKNAVLSRVDMPSTQLSQLISNDNPLTRDIGMRYLVQYPKTYLDDKMIALLQQTFAQNRQTWQGLMETASQRPTKLSETAFINDLEITATTLQHLIWLQGRYLSLPEVVHVLQWLTTLITNPVISASPLLATHIDIYWQKLLLALLARPVATQEDPKAKTELLTMLQAIASGSALTALSYANQTLLKQLLKHIETHADVDKNIDQTKAKASADVQPITLSPSQQIIIWLKEDNAQALFDWATDAYIETVTRIAAIEALGQIRDPAVGDKLTALLANADNADRDSGRADSEGAALDEALQKLTYKVLRRWQRMMSRAEQKRPAPFATASNMAQLTQMDGQQQQGEQ